MSNSTTASADDRISELECTLRWSRTLLGAALLIALIALLVAMYGLRRESRTAQFLRARGIVLVDEQNRPRILLGTPIPSVPERKRKDGDGGIIVIGSDGTDRLQLGFNPGPQCGGQVQRRISPEVGMIANDSNGNERGGFGVMDNQRVVLGLDYPTCREGVEVYVLPDKGTIGVSLSADADGQDVDRMVLEYNKEGRTYQYLQDEKNKKRFELRLKGVHPVEITTFSGEGIPEGRIVPNKK
jgi:hypothetical protein